MPSTEAFHKTFVWSRRISVIADHIATMLPKNARVIDIGAGTGEVASLVVARRSDVSIVGVDVGIREHTAIPVRLFDGTTLPFADRSFDAALLIDVLHHTLDPRVLLREAARVAPLILLKDHTKRGLLAGPVLTLMDYVGNSYSAVPLPNNYFTPDRWQTTFAQIGLKPIEYRHRLALYPWPATLVFDRGLHFFAALQAP